MSPARPAVRAYKAEPHLNPGGIWHSALASSPGAGSTVPHLYYIDEEQADIPPVLSTGTPVSTPDLSSGVPVSSIGETPASTTVVQVSTSVATVLIPKVSSVPSPVPTSTSPEAISSSVTVPSSSLPPPLVSTTSLPAPSSTAPRIDGSDHGSSSLGMLPEMTSVLSGSRSGTNRSALSGGVIAAIVIILLLAFIVAVFLLFRMSRIQKRTARRVTWTAALGSRLNAVSSLEKGVTHVDPISPRPPPVTDGTLPAGGDARGVAQTPIRTIARKPPLPYSPMSPTAPPQSNNEPPHSPAPSPHPSTIHTVPSPSMKDGAALVRVTFVPQLPDELPITPGETLYIRSEFDDGWAMCVNTHGKRGMVPLECLEGGGGQFSGFPRAGDRRNSRRASSRHSAATWT
ncbi:hypothetical protein BJV78DRAFT_1278245 [Lactifluus subvellereus]|nr:hypothetical protein BJV78DRAFT_1278245 [Lactifluus subvellereus]